MREVKLGRQGWNWGASAGCPVSLRCPPPTTSTRSQASEHLVVLKTRDCVGRRAGKQREGSRDRQVSTYPSPIIAYKALAEDPLPEPASGIWLVLSFLNPQAA